MAGGVFLGLPWEGAYDGLPADCHAIITVGAYHTMQGVSMRIGSVCRTVVPE